MRNSFLVNKHIRLRAVEPEDLEIMYQIENAPEMWEISSFVEPYSRYALREYISACQNDLYADKQLRLIIESVKTGEVKGTIDLDHFDPRHSRAGVGLAVTQSARKQGIALQSLQLIVDYAFHFLHLQQLYAYIPIPNKASMHLFQKAEFQPTAVLQKWVWTADGFEDVAVWQKINPDQFPDL